jgi:hypothetical protein
MIAIGGGPRVRGHRREFQKSHVNMNMHVHLMANPATDVGKLLQFVVRRPPLKMTRSKQESTATIKLVNLATKRDSVFMASSGMGPLPTPFWQSGRRTPFSLILFGRGSAALG